MILKPCLFLTLTDIVPSASGCLKKKVDFVFDSDPAASVSVVVLLNVFVEISRLPTILARSHYYIT